MVPSGEGGEEKDGDVEVKEVSRKVEVDSVLFMRMYSCKRLWRWKELIREEERIEDRGCPYLAVVITLTALNRRIPRPKI